MIQVRAEQKGLTFTYQLDPGLPSGVLVDEKRLREVLLNLLSNAVKYTETGGVELFISKLSLEGEAEVKVRFQVTDTGIGLAPEVLEEIFVPFYQVAGGSSQIEGTGLGLTISRHLVQLMGGELQVKSTFQQGSTFWFDLILPLAAIEAAALGEADPIRRVVGFKGGPLKILVVDDRPENRAVLRETLSPLGFMIAQAANGQEALAYVSKTRPDLILMDLVMPVMDGFKAILYIRQQVMPEPIPIIVMSASVDRITREWCKEVGADDFLTKPIRLAQLLACLESQLKIEWLYELPAKDEPAPPAELRERANLPPVEALLALQSLAQGGLVTGLEQYLAKISQTDAAYLPFVESISHLVDRFEFEEIIALIDHCLGEEA
jgi:CheY-like chemotaxis protein